MVLKITCFQASAEQQQIVKSAIRIRVDIALFFCSVQTVNRADGSL